MSKASERILIVILILASACSHPQSNARSKDSPAALGLGRCDLSIFQNLNYQKITDGFFYSNEFKTIYRVEDLRGEWTLLGFYFQRGNGKIWNEFTPTGIRRELREDGGYDIEIDPPEPPFYKVVISGKKGTLHVTACDSSAARMGCHNPQAFVDITDEWKYLAEFNNIRSYGRDSNWVLLKLDEEHFALLKSTQCESR